MSYIVIMNLNYTLPGNNSMKVVEREKLFLI